MWLHGRVPHWPSALRLLAFAVAIACWIYAVMGPGVKSYDARTTVAGAIGGWLLVLSGSALFLMAVLGMSEPYDAEGELTTLAAYRTAFTSFINWCSNWSSKQ